MLPTSIISLRMTSNGCDTEACAQITVNSQFLPENRHVQAYETKHFAAICGHYSGGIWTAPLPGPYENTLIFRRGNQCARITTNQPIFQLRVDTSAKIYQFNVLRATRNSFRTCSRRWPIGGFNADGEPWSSLSTFRDISAFLTRKAPRQEEF